MTRYYIDGGARLYIWARHVYIWARHEINAIYCVVPRQNIDVYPRRTRYKRDKRDKRISSIYKRVLLSNYRLRRSQWLLGSLLAASRAPRQLLTELLQEFL